MNSSTKMRLIEIARWTLIFPCAVIVFLLLHSLFSILCSVAWTNENPDFFRFIKPIFLSGPSSYMAIVCGIGIAPNHKIHTSLAFVIFCSIILGITLTLYFLNETILDSFLEIVGILIGSIAVYIKLYKGEDFY